MLNNIKTTQKDRGFTIVELLIVIVVIGILAAITMVAYGNITTRANANSAKANAANVAKVAEAYNADDANTGYPTADQLKTYNGVSKLPAGISLMGGTSTANGHLAAGALSGSTATHVSGKVIQYTPKGTTGGCVGYWDAVNGNAQYIYVGNGVTGTNSATPTCA